MSLRKRRHTAHASRSIMLRNWLANVHHAYMRTRFYAIIHCSSHAAQTGGIKGRGTDLANSTIRWCQHGLKGQGKSCIIFYTDIRAAFYSVIRELILPQAQSPYSLDDIIDELGIPLLFVVPLEKLLADPSLLPRLLGDDQHLLQMLTSSQSMTRSQVPGHDAIALAATGCGPGDPLADILYNVAMIPDMEQVDLLLAQAGLRVHWPETHETPFWDLCVEPAKKAALLTVVNTVSPLLLSMTTPLLHN